MCEITPCVKETPCANETPCMEETPCVSGVVTSVPECVLPSTPCMKGEPQVEEAAFVQETARVCEARCVSGTTCAPETARVCEQPCGSEARCLSETPRVSAPTCVSGMVCVSEARVSERPCVRRTACVRSLCSREMTVGMHEHAAASPGVSLNVSLVECSLGVVTRRCAWGVERRRRLRQLRDKSRVAAVVSFGTVPGLHGSERVVRAVQRTRPPRARLRG